MLSNKWFALCERKEESEINRPEDKINNAGNNKYRPQEFSLNFYCFLHFVSKSGLEKQNILMPDFIASCKHFPAYFSRDLLNSPTVYPVTKVHSLQNKKDILHILLNALS